MGIINQILLSLIFIILTIIFIKLKLRKNSKEDIDIKKEFTDWKGNKAEFIRFKEYQYNQTFTLVFGLIPFTVFSLSILFGFSDQIRGLIGSLPFITIFLCFGYVIKRFLDMVFKANDFAIKNIKQILES